MALVEQDMRRKLPGKCRKADHENSRAAAIQLHCVACCGGSRKDAKACDVFDCFLFPFGLAEAKRPAGAVPSVFDYEAASLERASDAQLEHWETLRGEGGSNDEDE